MLHDGNKSRFYKILILLGVFCFCLFTNLYSQQCIPSNTIYFMNTPTERLANPTPNIGTFVQIRCLHRYESINNIIRKMRHNMKSVVNIVRDK